MKMYIGSLQYNTSEEELTELFSEFGKVESIELIKDRQTGQSKGFGFVEMPNNSEADTAIKALNGSNFQGRMIKVNQAQNKSKNNRSSRGKRY